MLNFTNGTGTTRRVSKEACLYAGADWLSSSYFSERGERSVNGIKVKLTHGSHTHTHTHTHTHARTHTH